MNIKQDFSEGERSPKYSTEYSTPHTFGSDRKSSHFFVNDNSINEISQYMASKPAKPLCYLI